MAGCAGLLTFPLWRSQASVPGGACTVHAIRGQDVTCPCLASPFLGRETRGVAEPSITAAMGVRHVPSRHAHARPCGLWVRCQPPGAADEAIRPHDQQTRATSLATSHSGAGHQAGKCLVEGIQEVIDTSTGGGGLSKVLVIMALPTVRRRQYPAL